MTRRKILTISVILCIAVPLALGVFLFERANRFKSMADEAFSLSSQRKSEGYYTAEFEFKILGILYLFDHGHYLESYRKFNDLYNQFKTTSGLVRIPRFANATDEMEFYLGLQNPVTGAFMDSTYPLPTYFGPTLNVIEHLQKLAESTGQRLLLRHPLKFLEQLDEPEELRAYLDDLSTVGSLVSKLPETPYILSSLDSYSELEELDLFSFSAEWKKALARSIWESQDPQTGFWGVRLRRTGELAEGGDINVTYKHIKELRDENGDNRYDEFPLRFTDKLIEKTLSTMSPEVSPNRSEQHKWSINQNLTARMLFDRLWPDLSGAQRQAARQQTIDILDTVFSRFYVPSEGAFNLYADATNADLDGTQTYVGFLQVVGFFSTQRRLKLWGEPEATLHQTQTLAVAEISQQQLLPFDQLSDVNSIRFYRVVPDADGYVSGALSVHYPKPTNVPDTLDLAVSLNRWIHQTSQSMGNWASRESLMARLETNDPIDPALGDSEAALAEADLILKQQGGVIAIGFDTLQMPRQMITYVLEK